MNYIRTGRQPADPYFYCFAMPRKDSEEVAIFTGSKQQKSSFAEQTLIHFSFKLDRRRFNFSY